MFRNTSSRVRKLYSYIFHCYRNEGKIKENVAIKPEENILTNSCRNLSCANLSGGSTFKKSLKLRQVYIYAVSRILISQHYRITDVANQVNSDLLVESQELFGNKKL